MIAAKHTCVWLLCCVLSSLAFAAEAKTEDLLSEEEDIDQLYTKRVARGHRFISPAASLFLPGFGQAINQEYVKALVHLGTFAAFNVARRWYETDEEFKATKAYYESRNKKQTYVNRDQMLRSLYSTLQVNTALYSSFDAYRVATLSREDVPYGDIPVSKESFTDLALAPFTPKYLSDPFVVLPLASSAIVFILRNHRGDKKKEDQARYVYEDDVSTRLLVGSNLSRHVGVALGEEVFFRGTINTETVRYLGPTAGILASSTVFGLAHTGVGTSASAEVAGLYGLYLGYMQYEKKGKLGYNVALHYWWNVIAALSAIGNSEKAEVTIPLLSTEF